MHASSGDADFGTHAEFAAIGELCRCIDHDDGAVDPLQEAFGAVPIFGDDAVCMVGPIGGNMVDG